MHPRNPDLEAKDLHPKVQNGSAGVKGLRFGNRHFSQKLGSCCKKTQTFNLRLAQELTQKWVNTSRDPQTRKSLSKQIVQILNLYSHAMDFAFIDFLALRCKPLAHTAPAMR